MPSPPGDEDEDFILVHHSDVQLSEKAEEVYAQLLKILKEQHEVERWLAVAILITACYSGLLSHLIMYSYCCSFLNFLLSFVICCFFGALQIFYRVFCAPRLEMSDLLQTIHTPGEHHRDDKVKYSLHFFKVICWLV